MFRPLPRTQVPPISRREESREGESVKKKPPRKAGVTPSLLNLPLTGRAASLPGL